jgi:transposase-like protein
MIKPIKTSSSTTRRKFDETFKREAVANWLSSGKSATVIGEELGISPERLYAWRKPFGPADAGVRGDGGACSLEGLLGALRSQDQRCSLPGTGL